MAGLTAGPRPDITPPQIIGMTVAGIPILAQLLRAFGIYDLSADAEEALSNAVNWATVIGGSLIGGDALLRLGRNLRMGHVEAAIAQLGEGNKLEIVNDRLKPGTTLDDIPPVDQSTTYPGAGAAAGFEQSEPKPSSPPPSDPPPSIHPPG